MDSQYQVELKTAFTALQCAAQISQSVISQRDKGALDKDDLSPVTVADFAVQALLAATFKHAFPRDRFVGEEDATALRSNPILLARVFELLAIPSGARDREDDGAVNGSTGHSSCMLPSSPAEMCDLMDECGSADPGDGGSGSGRTWIFDPIDGTKTYVRGELYAINIGLLVDGEQTVGVIGCPNLSPNPNAPLRNEHVDKAGCGCIMFAVKGHGAFIRPMYGDAEGVAELARRLPLTEPENNNNKICRTPSGSVSDSPVCFVTCTTTADSALPGIHEAVAQRLNAAPPTCDLVPWVLRWAALAMGLGNATVWAYRTSGRRAKAWDHAGAMLLFEETGGRITDIFGKDIDLTAGRQLKANTGFVAALGGALHAKVMRAMHEVLLERGQLDQLVHAQ